MTGAQLKKRREQMGLTQQGLASVLKIARNTVARWERDEVGMPPYLKMALDNIESKRKELRTTKIVMSKEPETGFNEH